MNTYSKRDIYIKSLNYGRNNLGLITNKNKKSPLIKNNKKIYVNYSYIYKISNLKEILIAKIIDYVYNKINCTTVYKISILNKKYNLGFKYIPLTKNLNIGDYISLGTNALIKNGNIIPLFKVPVGSYIHNIETCLGKGSKLVKNSKKSALVISKGLKYITVKLPSGEIRLFNKNLFCILGELIITKTFKLNKAGEAINLGKRPKVRGVAMNACDHPHGGGEGKNSIGRKAPYTPWGKLFKGILTRKKRKYSNKYIISNK